MEPDDFIKKVGPLTKVFLPELYDQVIEYHTNTQFQFIYDILPLRLNSTIIKEKEEDEKKRPNRCQIGNSFCLWRIPC